MKQNLRKITVLGIALSTLMVHATDQTPKLSLGQRFKASVSKVGTSIKSGLTKAGTTLKSGAQKVGSTFSKAGSSFGSGAKKFFKNEKVQEGLAGAFGTGLNVAQTMGQTALEQKYAKENANLEHAQAIEMTKAQSQQERDMLAEQQRHEKETLREQQEHELKMKMLEVDIERLRLQGQTEANNTEVQKLKMQLDHEKELAAQKAQGIEELD